MTTHQQEQEFWRFMKWALICTTLFIIALMIINHDWSYTIKFQMDNNTLEAIKSIDWKSLHNATQ